MQTTSAARLSSDTLLTDRPQQVASTVSFGPMRANESETRGDARTPPQWTSRSSGYALAARVAGRLNAASIGQSEVEELLQERKGLLDKLFAATITKKERARLEYVRWSLDRIEDARHGTVLDIIENAVEQYEDLLEEIRAARITLNRQI